MTTHDSDRHLDPKAGKPLVEKEQEVVVPVIEEQVKVGKEVVETGRVSLTKRVDTRQERVELPLIEERVEVERKPIDRYVDELPSVRTEGDTTIYPVTKEVLVVEKKILLVEEIHVSKRKSTSVHEETVELRHESVHIERKQINPERPG